MNQKSKSAGSNMANDRDDSEDKTVPGATGERREGRSLKPDTTLQGAARRSRRSEVRRNESPSPESAGNQPSQPVRPDEPW